MHESKRALYGINTDGLFSDDTGLEIDALQGAPGVYSARYAGPSKDSEANMAKVLNELKGKEDRKSPVSHCCSADIRRQRTCFRRHY